MPVGVIAGPPFIWTVEEVLNAIIEQMRKRFEYHVRHLLMRKAAHIGEKRGVGFAFKPKFGLDRAFARLLRAE